MKAQPKVIAIEEHFWTPELRAASGVTQYRRSPDICEAARRSRRVASARDGRSRHRHAGDLGNCAGSASSRTRASQSAGAQLERLPSQCDLAHPDRFAGFAALPTPVPKAAADELERAVTKLGFKGAMIMGLSRGAFPDEKQFWPIFERAAALDVPIYFHPAPPHPAVVEAYYEVLPVPRGRGAWIHDRGHGPGHAVDRQRRARRVSEPQNHSWTSGRRVAIPDVAQREGPLALSSDDQRLRRLCAPPFLGHDERRVPALCSHLHHRRIGN